ncbi:MAG: LUD domain-containing protein [Syntrophales bacterium]|nr:LUD domain-containing protein [Syntrophales bacterium]
MDTRKEIINRLRSAPRSSSEPRPDVPPLPELALGRSELIQKLMDELTKLEVSCHRVVREEVREKLAEILVGEGITKVIVSNDRIVSAFDLSAWGKERGFMVYRSSDFNDRDTLKRVVFEEVEAGVTGVDFAVAESGTLGIIHDHNQPRLVSLAPVTHIALVPTSKVVPIYEQVVDEVFLKGGNIPSQFTFITGPSMTADIKATPFKGMHGPRRLIAIIYDDD